MLCDVVLLRRRGLRLKPKELEPPVRGDLVITDRGGEPAMSSFKRPVRAAKLYGLGGNPEIRREVLQPIFDAEVIRVEGSIITVVGIELQSVLETRQLWEHVQIWRCTLVAAPEGLPPEAGTQR